MTILELLNRANQGYPDRLLSAFYNKSTGAPHSWNGDTLAKFIVLELHETYDSSTTDQAQLSTAIQALRQAVSELEGVIQALANTHQPLGRVT